MIEIGKVYQFIGTSLGRQCNFPVEVLEEHFDIPGFFKVRAIAAFNCWYVPDWVSAKYLAAEPHQN